MTERYARIPERALSCRELSATDWRVFFCIALHADSLGRAYPGMTLIAKMVGIRRGDVPRAILHLEQVGILRRERRQHRTGGPDSNLYVLCPDEVSAPMRTGVRNDDDSGCPHDRGQGVRKFARNGVRSVADQTDSEQTIEQTLARSGRSGGRETDIQDSANGNFETFWRVYPHRGGHPDPKKPARLKFEAAVKRGTDPAHIIRGAENYRAAVEANSTDARYVAQAQTWLSQERWNDYQETPQPPRLRVGMN
jgi:predicted transcriptional regulator